MNEIFIPSYSLVNIYKDKESGINFLIYTNGVCPLAYYLGKILVNILMALSLYIPVFLCYYFILN